MQMGATANMLNNDQQQIEHMKSVFARQKQAYQQRPFPDAAQRIAGLKRLKVALLAHQEDLINSMNQDFSARSRDETLLAEMMTSIEGINDTIKHVKKWMKPSRRSVGMAFAPASNKVYYQPKGVVGNIVPWNYPIYLCVGPTIGALAAGNRVMIKLSEFTPATNEVLKKVFAEAYNEDEVAIITGEANVGVAFSQLPLDHLFFTGSTTVGRYVMAAAAKNLTPVTLELGGKSPTIIGEHGDITDAAKRIAFGKCTNAGQTCVAPDYVLCPESKVDALIQALSDTYKSFYPSLKNNGDYTAIVNERQLSRLQSLVQDAKEKGANIRVLNPAAEDLSGTRKMPLHLLTGGTDDMKVMQDEIFGPILPIVAYRQLDEALEYINSRPRPLALYVFSYNKAEQQHILHNTHSGGVSINDTLVHLAQDDMPFGGVGDSGMGHYHGKEGFLTFSHAKAVHKKGRFSSGVFIFPPHGTFIHKMIYKFFIR